jgi:FMN phosphatase YigB (HAD superfamily)
MADTTGQQLSDGQASALQSLFDKTRMELFKFEAGVADLVSFLAANALVTVIITNGNDVIQRDKLLACRASELFPHVLIGGGVTFTHPHHNFAPRCHHSEQLVLPVAYLVSHLAQARRESKQQ